ncbi:DUF3626 domain-containing protein [Agrococcus sp. SGAir0287]|uniref:DUF3626 domain-containing protein n=1 Tax=Agrococcus sp. SGAir0287 TaxID=2070347 RepID=UPI0010CCCA88|nr:DUF3626 domain-containing protein [Agrococcus sp. SGAir0287]QCR19924.1 DUF3626 domain-containing protein [Agrococcus sp. SGAir0287]
MDRWADAAIAHVRRRARGGPAPRDLDVDVHLHPDRLRDGVTVVEALATGGVYRTQWETGTSNGGLTAVPGGDRDRWERRLFGGAYDTAPAAARPRYGALNWRRRAIGGGIRFGSSRLVLSVAARPRVTYCFPDSALEPQAFATDDRFALLPLAASSDLDPLDDAIEAHVHGGLDLARDVARIVLDPSFRGTAVEDAARSLPVPLAWHPGLVLPIERLRRVPAYRGPDVVALGERVAQHGLLDARIVGLAAASGEHDPQVVKRLWHCVARWGAPIG